MTKMTCLLNGDLANFFCHLRLERTGKGDAMGKDGCFFQIGSTMNMIDSENYGYVQAAMLHVDLLECIDKCVPCFGRYSIPIEKRTHMIIFYKMLKF